MSASGAELLVLDRAQREVSRPMSATEIQAGVNLIQQVMKAVMKKDIHFGTIPGTPKPTLYQPGADKILSTFRIAVEPVVEDLSSIDEARYRVAVRAIAQSSGVLLGVGVGECSSSEEKYRWRKPVCVEEFNETAEDRRRVVWKKGNDGPYQLKQIRTNPADVANTILKMATKRGKIAVTLTVTAASDIFAQDIEDLPEEIVEEIAREEGGTVNLRQPEPLGETEHEAPPATSGGGEQPKRAGIYVVGVRVMKEKKAEGDERGWKLYGVKLSNDVEYSTLKDSLANIAKTAFAHKSPVAFEAGEFKGKQTLESIEELR